jgi:soluble lytic murein transglycosylase-like protein
LKKAALLLACVCALPVAATTASGASGPSQPDTTATTTTTSSAPQAKAAGARLQARYARWRRKLARHEVWHGRNLVRAARSDDRKPTARELRRSVRRMKKRFVRWSGTYEGRATVYRFKVRRIPAWGRSHLRSIAWCESRNNPRAASPAGYRGLYQFSYSTWRVVGGSGDPAAAPRSEQTWRAWRLLKNHGAGHWPVCG